MKFEFVNPYDTELALDPETLSALAPKAQVELEALDVNANGRVDYETEALCQTLLTPNGLDEIVIIDEGSWQTYLALVYSAKNVSAFLPRGILERPQITAEEWLVAESESLRLTGPLKVLDGRRFELADLKLIAGEYHLLLQFYADLPEDRFSFTVRLPAAHSEIKNPVVELEFNGSVFSFTSLLEGRSTAGMAQALLKDLILLFCTEVPGMDDGFRLEQHDRFEATFYQLKRYIVPAPRGFFPDPDTLLALRERVKLSENDLMPGDGAVTVRSPQGPRRVPILSEKSLSDGEFEDLQKLLGSVPAALYGILDANGVMPVLRVEVIEDDLMDFYQDADTVAVYDKQAVKLYVRRSSLKHGEPYLQDLLTHELLHGVFPVSGWDKYFPGKAVYNRLRYGSWFGVEDSDYYFLNELYEKAVQAGIVARIFPSVTIYSLDNVFEFFAECALAYLKGEMDANPWVQVTHGPLSRAELRDKLPEMYFALKLFFEPGSPYYGNHEVFSQASKERIAAVLDKPVYAIIALAPQTPAAVLAGYYEMDW